MSCWRWVLLWVFPFGAAHSRWQSGTLRSDAGDELGVFRVLDVVFRVKSHELSQPINQIHVRTPSQLQARSWLLVFLMMRNEVNTLPVYVWNGGTSTSTLSPPNTFNCFFPINLYADCVEEDQVFPSPSCWGSDASPWSAQKWRGEGCQGADVNKDVCETHSWAFLGGAIEKLFKPWCGSRHFIDSREAVETITTGSGSFETGSRLLVGVSVQPWEQCAVAVIALLVQPKLHYWLLQPICKFSSFFSKSYSCIAKMNILRRTSPPRCLTLALGNSAQKASFVGKMPYFTEY